MTRKEFARLTALGAAISTLPTGWLEAETAGFKSQRPAAEQRRFTSEAVEALIAEVKKNIGDEELGWMFENCFPNTLDTTVFYEIKNGVPDTYVITGDIDAMWLRDSSAQVNPYLPLVAGDKHLSSMVEGLIRRQARCILLDPYANAFYKDEHKESPWKSDRTEMKPGVHERKWEVDSLCYCIRLAYQYCKLSHNTAPFDADWYAAMKTVVSTFKDQQRKNDKGKYYFQRVTTRKTDTQAGDGYGNPWKPTGMICSAFRNSDDATTYLFNIPENLFAVTSLRQLAEMLKALDIDKENLAADCLALANEIEQAALKYGTVEHREFGTIYAYECDGLGKQLLMDDAGLPGLVSIPYLAYGSADDEIYKHSRRFALSKSNPYYYQSSIADGIGSPHTIHAGKMIWPIGIIARAVTSTDKKEIAHCLKMLKTTHAGKGFMHESFQKDKPEHFTRHWFAWANSFFGEMIWKLYKEGFDFKAAK